MPYIVTTKPSERVDGFDHYHRADETETAVATLDEARTAAAAIVDNAHTATGQPYDRQWEGWAATNLYVDESGGTVGPLPDGTVIEVRPA